MEQILSVPRNSFSEIERYACIIRKKIQEFGLFAINSLPEELGLNLEERLLLDLFLEKQRLINLRLDGSVSVVWWVKIFGLPYPSIHNTHKRYIEQAYKLVGEDLDANIQASVENFSQGVEIDPNSEEISAWKLEIRYMAQIAHNILRRLKGNLEKSPIRFELRLEYRRQVDKVINRRKNLLEKGLVGSSEVS